MVVLGFPGNGIEIEHPAFRIEDLDLMVSGAGADAVGTEKMIPVQFADQRGDPDPGKIVRNAEHFLGDGIVINQMVGIVDNDNAFADGVEDGFHETVFACEQMDIGVDRTRIHGIQFRYKLGKELISGHKCHIFRFVIY